jgi:hypothetical protein
MLDHLNGVLETIRRARDTLTSPSLSAPRGGEGRISGLSNRDV